MSNPFETIDQRLTSIEQLLHSILANTPEKKEDSDILGVKETAAMLRISISRLYQTVANYPHKKVGGKLLFSRKELNELLESKRVKTKDERFLDTDKEMSDLMVRKKKAHQ